MESVFIIEDFLISRSRIRLENRTESTSNVKGGQSGRKQNVVTVFSPGRNGAGLPTISFCFYELHKLL